MSAAATVRFETALRWLAAEHPPFRAEAFRFVSEAVAFTVQRRQAAAPPAAGGQRPARHIRGQELLAGFRDLALERFGCLARTVLADWGLNQSEDVGRVVFLLVEHKLLGASDQDSPADFADGFDFDRAFRQPFTPSHAAPPAGIPPIL
ncbi:MAG: Minf_1886 family protein [Lentisphaeria bacterium]|jgi:uncharacterized repeat protein (TIGR04138 family)